MSCGCCRRAYTKVTQMIPTVHVYVTEDMNKVIVKNIRVVVVVGLYTANLMRLPMEWIGLFRNLLGILIHGLVIFCCNSYALNACLICANLNRIAGEPCATLWWEDKVL